jgi:hypothetical protein
MKEFISDIVDKFTICKLKTEKLNIDLTQELNRLKSKIDSYDNLKDYIDSMYDINKEIWDTKWEIFENFEETFNTEIVNEITLKIENLNKKKINHKNVINSILNEFPTKHKFDSNIMVEKSLVISLTTVPERLMNQREDGIKSVLKSLCEQQDDDYEIHFNIPDIYMPTNTTYVIPEWIEHYKLKYPHLKIFRTEDLGPPTKLVPTLKRLQNDDTIILVVDDDLIYHEELISEHRKYQKELVDCVIGYDGRGCNIPLYNGDLRDNWIICVTQIRETHFLQHYKSVSYKKKLFLDNFFSYYVGKTFSDDVLISKYFRNSGIKMYVVPYIKDNFLYETKELWEKNQGVVSFPILRYAASVTDTGCNHPELLKIQPKFYEPPEFDQPNIKRNHNSFDTDKISHGYMQIYDPLFSNLKSVKKVLEIGVYNCGSLKMLSHYFKNSTIYGIDLSNTTFCDTEKIKTYVYDQEKKEDLLDFIEKNGNDFDLIIDDGGHSMKQQQTSFGTLFRYLKSGGVYIVEDLHTSKIDRFISENDIITTLEMLEKFKSESVIVSNYISDEDIEYLNNNIESIQIWSRTPKFDESVTSIIRKK